MYDFDSLSSDHTILDFNLYDEVRDLDVTSDIITTKAGIFNSSDILLFSILGSRK